MQKSINVLNALAAFTMKDGNGNRFAEMPTDRVIAILDSMTPMEWAALVMAAQAAIAE